MILIWANQQFLYMPSLNFSDGRDSQYIALLFEDF